MVLLILFVKTMLCAYKLNLISKNLHYYGDVINSKMYNYFILFILLRILNMNFSYNFL